MPSPKNLPPEPTALKQPPTLDEILDALLAYNQTLLSLDPSDVEAVVVCIGQRQAWIDSLNEWMSRSASVEETFLPKIKALQETDQAVDKHLSDWLRENRKQLAAMSQSKKALSGYTFHKSAQSTVDKQDMPDQADG